MRGTSVCVCVCCDLFACFWLTETQLVLVHDMTLLPLLLLELHIFSLCAPAPPIFIFRVSSVCCWEMRSK